MKTELGGDASYCSLLDQVARHDEYMTGVVNLIASGNLISPTAKRILLSDLLSRAAEGTRGNRVFAGMMHYEPIEELGEQLLKSMVSCEYADLRPISGSQANLIALSAVLKPGDTLLTIPIKHGGHISMSGNVYSRLLGINIVPISYLPERADLDYDDAVQKIATLRPAAVLLGGSVLVYEPQVSRVAAAAKAVGSIVLYDASHIAGFVLTGYFPDPFKAGTDIMTFTTCKTVPGPSHAVILSKDEFRERIQRQVFPGFVSGGHLNELAAAVLALLELKTFGREYIAQVLANAQRLALRLQRSGFTILEDSLRGPTHTHQILWDVERLGGGKVVEQRLEGANILCNRNMLFKDRDYRNPSGIRLGTQEVTRLGMRESDMDVISGFICRAVDEHNNMADLRNAVIEFRSAFQTVRYCFDDSTAPPLDLVAHRHTERNCAMEV